MSYTQQLIEQGCPADTVMQFFAWHNQHPEIWKAFEIKTLELIKSGVSHFGAKAIAESIRYDESVKGGTDFKLNNNFVSYYSRVFVLKYPQHKDFFEFREIEGLKKAA